MSDWQITATTINCDFVGDEVTIIVHKDGSVKCTGFCKYGNPHSKETTSLTKNELRCLGPLCDHMKSYHDKLFKEVKTPNEVDK